MEPIARALDYPQGDKFGLGALLPRLESLKVKLGKIKEGGLVWCEPLVDCLLTAIGKRFEGAYEDTHCFLAAASDPRFVLFFSNRYHFNLT